MSMIYERRDKNKADLHRTVTARKLLIYLVDVVAFFNRRRVVSKRPMCTQMEFIKFHRGIWLIDPKIIGLIRSWESRFYA